MKTKYVADLETKDELLNEPFLVQEVVRRTTRDGRPYLLCTYSDRTGQASGIFWDVPQHIDDWVRPGAPVLVTGRVTYYKNAIQINTTDLNQWQSPDMSEFLPSSKRPREEMLEELHQHIATLASPWQELVSRVLLEPDFFQRFMNAPAARHMHHAYIGGLLEHTLSMAQLALTMAEHYPYINRDLLLAGTLLHDAGKAVEYEIGCDFSFSDDGRLVGHIVRAITMVEKAAQDVEGLKPEQLRHLIHLLASHHGTQEWGSPVIPKTLEAVLLHQLDLLDSRVQGFFDHLNNDNSDERWSVRYSQMFNTELRRPAGFGDE
ncbi:MAG TPA: HD domain-containing protein [Candidatus Sulfomarinibacteraceae bacterium]|nr:HD domain-containing protein [Candidatus Sulfomarinibacteraceae bacterium]